jgi:nicotinate-nucleotide adenylyltransferase
MRIGLLGGSFNPAHEGHVHASALALTRLDLDYVWWLVSPQNPLKPSRDMAGYENRLRAARDFNRHPRVLVTGIEEQFGTRYTIDTLAALKRRFPPVHFVWLMGSDNLIQLPRWRKWQQILLTMPVAVIARSGTALAARNAKAATCFRSSFVPYSRHISVMRPPVWTILDSKRNPASATALRRGSRPSRS